MTVLVFHLGSLGDTIVTIPLLRAVRQRWPGERIVMLHNASAPGVVAPADVLEGSGLVDGYLAYRPAAAGGCGQWRALSEAWHDVRRMGAGVVVFAGPTDRGPLALIRDRLFFRSAGIGRLVGFRTGAQSRCGPAPSRRHEASRKLERLGPERLENTAALLEPPLLTPGRAAVARATAWCRAHAGARRLVAVGPGSLMPAKDWPLDRFVELGRRMLAAGITPVVVGGPAEQALGQDLLRHWNGGLNAAGDWPVLDSAALLARCDAYVGIDSGAAHLAAAVGTRAVVLTSGRAPRGQWDPLGPGHVVLRHATPCENCRHVVCPLPDHPCMHGLDVETAWRALTTVLQDAR